ncbi:MAG: site-2 protease family protein [Peptococcaceae bacterium]|nr:site-2 protease family protein [Peptococcaceae bacterium]
MFSGSSLTSMAATLLAILLAITFHETAHGYVAYRLGDPTAKNQGRLTLNPVAHLDPVGALMMFVAGFGWAKPVPVNPFYFNGDRTKGLMLVSVAGPVTNLLLSFASYFIYVAGKGFGTVPFVNVFLTQMILLNIYLAIFNLIPVPPLDGSKILAGFLPKAMAYKYLTTVEKYGFVILLILIVFNITDMILVPVANIVLNAMELILFAIF